MGNNNVTGQQVSEDPTHCIEKIIEPSNSSPEHSNTNSEKNNEKDDTEDINMSKSLKDSIISNGGDEQVASNQNYSSSKVEGLDEQDRSSTQENTSTKDNQSDNLANKDHELVKDVATETTIYPRETITPSSTTIEDMISMNESSVSSKKFEIVHGIQDRVGESIMGDSSSLLEENIEGSPEDGEEPRSHENTLMGGNLAGKDSNEILNHGHNEVSTREDQLMAMQGGTTSSTESIVSTYHDADDSKIKEVIIEDKSGQYDNPSYVQPSDSTNIETSRNCITPIPQKKEEINAISKPTTVEPNIIRDEVIEEDIPEYSVREVRPELEKHGPNEMVVSSRKISDSVNATLEHSGSERTYMKEEGIVDKTAAVQNLAEPFEKEEPEEYDDNLARPVELNRNDLTSLQLSSSDHLHTVHEEKEQKELNGVNEILECDKDTIKEILEQGDNAELLGQYIDEQVPAKEGSDLCNIPMITPSNPALLLEDFDKMGCIKFYCSDSNKGAITSIYSTRTRDTQDTITSSQEDQSPQQLVEEHEVEKLEDGGILSTGMQLVEDSLKVDKIFIGDSNHGTAGANAISIVFTTEPNQNGDTGTAAAVGFTAKDNQVKVTAGGDRATKDQYPLQTSTSIRASEETLLLQREEGISSFSHSTEQHKEVNGDKSVTDISAIQFKAEAKEESEKSPLLSPRGALGEFGVPNHSARKMKPFQSLLTEDRTGMLTPLKEQASTPNNNVLVRSPRSKGKQKTRSSLFTNCMCCVIPTN